MAFRLLQRRAVGILQSRSGAGATAVNGGGLGRAGDLADRLGRRGLAIWPVYVSKSGKYSRAVAWGCRGTLMAMWAVSYVIFNKYEELEDIRSAIRICKNACEVEEEIVHNEEQFRKEIKQKMESGLY